MQTVGLESVGAEVDELLSQMGIEGEGVPQRRIVPNGNTGRARVFPFATPQSASIANAASGSLTTNADRAAFIARMHLVGITAAGAAVVAEASFLTALSIGGRNALVGAGGYHPLSAFAHDATIRHSFGVVGAGNPVVATVLNNTGAAALYGLTFEAITID